MKNVFRFLGLALVAGAMLVSCGTNYTITVSANDDAMGTVTGGGEYADGATATIEAVANDGYMFVQWNDGNKDNPRTITVTADAEYIAEFAAASFADATIKGNTWRADALEGTDYSSYGLEWFDMYKNYSDANAESFGGYTATAAGTYTHASGDYYYFFYFENDDDYTEYNGSEYPTWQPQECTTNIAAIDLTAMTLSATVNGSVANINDLINENPDMETVAYNLNFKNAKWTAASAKGCRATKAIR